MSLLVFTEMTWSRLQKGKCTGSMFIQEYFIFTSRDQRYILVLLIRKNLTLESKIRNLFTVRSGHSNMLQQHANATNK